MKNRRQVGLNVLWAAPSFLLAGHFTCICLMSYGLVIVYEYRITTLVICNPYPVFNVIIQG